jgi:peptidoglycan/xylan/chitin deacetylase (PgdA/CDA1 family)
MLKFVKRGIYAGLNACSLAEAVGNSKWRHRRVLILCYHGIALRDEYRWRPALYMQREIFESRMQFLQRNNYTVLPLGEALAGLYAGDLPPRSVVLTFDDGGYDFFAVVSPILAEYGYPATVYLTTYYCEHNRPVFRLLCSYMLWKRSGALLESSLGTQLELGSRLDLRTAASQWAILRRIDFVVQGYRASDECEFARRLAELLELDYDEIIHNRLLHIMNPQEVAALAARGVDFQLHTHRHRLPEDESLFVREIEDNRIRIRNITKQDPVHFCYPSGEYTAQARLWLKSLGIASATTCDPGIAAPDGDPLLLPRFVDTSMQTQIEFETWISGVGSLVRRPGRKSWHTLNLSRERSPAIT